MRNWFPSISVYIFLFENISCGRSRDAKWKLYTYWWLEFGILLRAAHTSERLSDNIWLSSYGNPTAAAAQVEINYEIFWNRIKMKNLFRNKIKQNLIKRKILANIYAVCSKVNVFGFGLLGCLISLVVDCVCTWLEIIYILLVLFNVRTKANWSPAFEATAVSHGECGSGDRGSAVNNNLSRLDIVCQRLTKICQNLVSFHVFLNFVR